MNNNQMPYGWNPHFPGGHPGMPPFPPQGNNCNCVQDIRNLEGRVSRMERQIRRLEDRVARIEATYPIPTPFKDNNNYGPNSNYSSDYNMM